MTMGCDGWRVCVVVSVLFTLSEIAVNILGESAIFEGVCVVVISGKRVDLHL